MLHVRTQKCYDTTVLTGLYTTVLTGIYTLRGNVPNIV